MTSGIPITCNAECRGAVARFLVGKRLLIDNVRNPFGDQSVSFLIHVHKVGVDRLVRLVECASQILDIFGRNMRKRVRIHPVEEQMHFAIDTRDREWTWTQAGDLQVKISGARKKSQRKSVLLQ